MQSIPLTLLGVEEWRSGGVEEWKSGGNIFSFLPFPLSPFPFPLKQGGFIQRKKKFCAVG